MILFQSPYASRDIYFKVVSVYRMKFWKGREGRADSVYIYNLFLLYSHFRLQGVISIRIFQDSKREKYYGDWDGGYDNRFNP